MAKWHPASGKWGIFGETSGSKQAKKASASIGRFLGDLENFIKQINSTPFKIGCVSFLNFIHGWNGSDEECLQLFKSISPHCKYLLTSQPQYQSQSIKYLHSITNKVICYYNQIDIPRETHYLIELK